VRDVLQRSLRKSLVTASPAGLQNIPAALHNSPAALHNSPAGLQNSPAVLHNSPAATSTSTVSVTAVADDAGRKPLRSILHNSGSNNDVVNTSDIVGTEQLHEMSSGSKKTRYSAVDMN